MNIEYLRIFDKVIVADEKRRIVDREYTDNINDILLQENKIETIEDIIEVDNDKVQDFTFKIKCDKILFKSDLKFSLGFVILLLIFVVLSDGLGIVTSCIASIGCLVSSFFKKREIKKLEKKIDGLNYKISVANGNLEKEKNRLKYLKTQKSKNSNNIPNNEIVIVNGSKELNRIQRDLELAFFYKLKEDMINEKIENNSNILLEGKNLDEEDMNVLLEYVNNNKKKVRKKN